MGSIRSNNNGNGRVTASSPTAATTDEDGAGPVEEFSPPTTEQLNMRCTGVKRLLKEAAELRHANEMFCARPMEDNLFEWHFSVRGLPDSPYAGGVYHGRIVLPADYPMKPPNLILMTPNGRFETNKKICLRNGNCPRLQSAQLGLGMARQTAAAGFAIRVVAVVIENSEEGYHGMGTALDYNRHSSDWGWPVKRQQQASPFVWLPL
ncbi:hypothetical protein niasHS_007815 [Heterodera schachtii]|uniref:UBC core domain-containing protein n=1 Tax=Heterodera schachtii TaxID=97005 RepID=A0ABD2JPQ7_HETSC